MKVLYLNSSILKEHSVSNLLSQEILSHLKSKNSDTVIVEKNVGINPPAHLTLEVANAIRNKDTTGLSDSSQQNYQSILDSIKELNDADIVVIAAPMYNLSISSGLKTWVDQICQAGLTFSYTEKGPKGLVNDKPVIIVSARGGIYSVPPNNVLDHQEAYLTAVLGLIGIHNIKFIRAEGVNISPELKQQALDIARKSIKDL